MFTTAVLSTIHALPAHIIRRFRTYVNKVSYPTYLPAYEAKRTGDEFEMNIASSAPDAPILRPQGQNSLRTVNRIFLIPLQYFCSEVSMLFQQRFVIFQYLLL